jgi:hypothetical protein
LTAVDELEITISFCESFTEQALQQLGNSKSWTEHENRKFHREIDNLGWSSISIRVTVAGMARSVTPLTPHGKLH